LKGKVFLLGLGERKEKFPQNLTVQIWDADVVSADDFLGSLTLNLNRIPKPAKSPRRCNLEMVDQKNQRPTLNLFKNRRCKGWWPIVARETDDSQDITIAADEDGGGGRGGLVLKVSRGRLVLKVSRGGLVLKVSRGGLVLKVSRGGFVLKVSLPFSDFISIIFLMVSQTANYLLDFLLISRLLHNH